MEKDRSTHLAADDSILEGSHLAAAEDSGTAGQHLVAKSVLGMEGHSLHAKKSPTRSAVFGKTSNQNLHSIVERAAEVIGDRDKALRWLGTPVRGLDFATPISLLGTEEGARRVDTILGQMEHGIW